MLIEPSYNQILTQYCKQEVRRLWLRFIWHTHLINNTLMVSYRDLVERRPIPTISRICGHIGLPPSFCNNRTALGEISAATSKVNLKKTPSRNMLTKRLKNRITGSTISNRLPQLQQKTRSECWNIMKDHLPPSLLKHFGP